MTRGPPPGLLPLEHEPPTLLLPLEQGRMERDPSIVIVDYEDEEII